ncbi:MAG: PLP-dependent aminotransferase family protein [Chloroflexi bacterium]|nr:PLP-dependent aminotransferase family protein [Chloroflexota bacterium]
MATKGLDYSELYAKDLPPAAGPWEGVYPYNFTTGHGSPDLIPIDGFIESVTRALKREGRNLAVYYSNGGPMGNLALREFLVKKLRKYRGINVTVDEVMICSGSTQCILLINETLLEPGDTVITEMFTYAGALRNAQRRKANTIGIPLDDDGMRVDILESTLADLRSKGIRPKYIYTIPTCQNPTGTNLPMDRRREMLRISQEYGVPILEDECYADLIFDGEWEHAIRSLDDTNHVLHIGSFSKSLAPGVRLGYIVAPQGVMNQMLASKIDVGTNMVTPLMVADFLENNYEEHIETVRDMLHRKRDVLIASVREHFGPTVDFYEPRGGMLMWFKFPEGVDTSKPLEAAKKEGVIYNPGADWSADPKNHGSNYIRICYGLPSEDQIRGGIERLAKVFHQEVGVP